MENTSFLIRKPITDATLRVIGFEVTLTQLQPNSGGAILSMLLANSTGWPSGNKLVFVPADEATLDDPILAQVPKDHVVLVLSEQFPDDPHWLHRCKELKLQGFKFALHYNPMVSSRFNTVVDFFFLDPQLGIEAITAAIAGLGRPVTHYIAKGVHTTELFHLSRSAGLGRFQGTWFHHPELNAAKTISAAQSLVIELLNKVQQDVDDKDLEVLFKRDSGLSFRMLEYINSAGFGLGCEVESIRHAIQILGRNELFRWLTVLLVSEGSVAPPVLQSRAVMHGRFMELLGQELLGRHERARLFIVGVFSLLDAMLEMPMAHVLENILLPEAITDALISRQGIYAPFLQITEACETDGRELESLSSALGLSPEKVNKAHLDAIAWVEMQIRL